MAALLLLAAGCASPRRVALAEEHRPLIGSASTIGGLSKREIGAEINRSNTAAGLGAAGGLIGGLIGGAIDASVNTSRAKEAERSVSALRDSLLTFDVPATLAEALRKEVPKISWLKNQSVEVREMGDVKQLPGYVANSQADVVLLIDAKHSLNPSFDALIVTARVSLHPRSKDLLKTAEARERLPKLIYLNRLSTSWSPEDIYRNTAQLGDNAALWAAQDGKRARAALTSAMNELAVMIAYDLEQPARAGNGMYKADKSHALRTVSIVPDMPVVQGMRGYVEKRVEGRDWIRLPSGDLCALP